MLRKIPFIISICVLIFAIFIKISNFNLVKQMQLKVFDSFLVEMPRQYTPQPVKIVDIDDDSMEKIGQWPWPRSIMAKIIDRLTQAGVAAIAMDIVFPEEDRTSPKNILKLWNKEDDLSYLLTQLPDHDKLFENSIAESNVVTGFVLNNDSNESPEAKAGFSFVGGNPKPYLPNFTGAVITLPAMTKAANGNGALNSITDIDGILRRMPVAFTVGGDFMPSLSAEALRIAQGASTYIIKSVGASDEETYDGAGGITDIKIGNLQIPTDASGKFWIYYTDYVPERYISAWKVLDPDYDLSSLEGHIVFLGTSAAGLRDIRATPLSPTTSGVEVHVQAVEQVLTGEFITRPDWMHGAEIAFMIVIGLILISIMSFVSALWGAVFTGGILAGAVGFSWYLFTVHGLLIDPVTPGIAITLIYISNTILRFISTEREKKNVKDAFAHYMSPDLVDELAKNPDSLKLGGETKELTVLFCDIRGFTTISENFDAHSLTQFINEFLTPMTTIILDNRGTIDKYMGDCIMAFWNAPLSVEDHAQKACVAALEMINGLEKLNSEQKIKAKEQGRNFIPINIGIGLNTGDCCVGNMGSNQRFDYSILGDDVNLASRLEGQSKSYAVNVVIGEKTQKSISNLATLELDLITVKGKTKPVKIYSLLGGKELLENPLYQDIKSIFESMLLAYRSRQWSKAQTMLKQCWDKSRDLDGLSLNGLFEVYQERIENYMLVPPPKNWDGSYVATSK